MDTKEAISVFAALGQSTRLDTFLLLVAASPNGVQASEIAAAAGVPRNTMSNHLGILERAGLIRSERSSRQIFYSAELTQLANLTTFLMEDCCGGKPELCTPILSKLGQSDCA